MRKIITSLAFVFGATLFASAQKLPPVPILGSEVRTMKSAETGRTYDLYIHVPGNPPEAGKKYPVIFVMDGQWDFKVMDSIVGGLVYDKFIPETVIVGITYSGEKPDYGALRAMDYTPSAVTRLPGSGDAAKYLAFLKKELVPFIEKTYNTDPARRIMMGNSLGGLITLHAMMAEPGMFRGYMASSPAVSYDDNYLFKQEAKFFEAHKDLPARVYIAVGSDEGLTQPVKDFIKIFSGRGYKDLKLETRVMEGERHVSNKPEAYSRGLRFIFSQ